MGNYTDFLRLHSGPKTRVRRLYWVCGEEEAFRLAVVARVRELAGAEPYNTLSLNASETPETEIWAYLNQHPLDSEQKRLIIVHEAQNLTHLDRLLAWVTDNQTVRSRNAVAVFVSSDPDFEHETRDDFQKSSSSMIVRCSLPKDEDDRLKRACDVLCSWGNIDRTTAGVLVKRVNFDMGEALAVMRKASLFPDAKVSVAAVEILAPRRVEEDIVWSLISMNKRQAAEAASEGLSEVSVSNIIGSLAAHVEVLGRMHPHLATTRGVKDLAFKVGAREGHVRRLLPHARLHPRREAVRRTVLLNRMDAAWQRGAREGVLEALIALW